MGLVGHTLFEPGEVLELASIMTLDGDVRALELKGEVKHVHEQFQEYSIGVSFL